MVCELKHFNNLEYTSYGFYTTSFGHHNFKPRRERGHQAITNGEELRPLQLKLQQFMQIVAHIKKLLVICMHILTLPSAKGIMRKN